MPAKYGIFGTGIENWKPNQDKTVWVHKNNNKMHVFIRENAYSKIKAKYQIYHTEYGGKGAIISAPYDYAKTMVDARKIARKHLTRWNNPLQW